MFALLLTAFLLHPPVHVSGQILHLSEDDYVLPRISPDGRQLVVGRAYVRPEVGETTDVLLMDLATGTQRLLITHKQAEVYEVYETHLVGLEWADAGTVLVSLSDGDVGVTDLVVEASSGRIMRTEHSEDELYSKDFAAIARDAARYSRHFTAEELQRSLATGAKRMDAENVLILRDRFGEKERSLFRINTRKRSADRIGAVPATLRLADVTRVGGETFALLVDEGVAEIVALNRGRTSRRARWDTDPSAGCIRFQTVGRRLFVFLRPCSTDQPVNGELWELVDNQMVPQLPLENLDEISASSDGARIAIGLWTGEKREVRVIDSSVLRPAG
jgi:hypothetical protein